MQGKRTLTGQDLIEVIDLYRWGARMVDIAALYDVHKTTVRSNVRLAGVKLRTSSRPLRKRVNGKIPYAGYDERELTSTLKKKRAPAKRVVDFLTPDQLLRSSARAQLNKRIAKRRSGVSKRSYQAKASVSRSGSSHTGSRRKARGLSSGTINDLKV